MSLQKPFHGSRRVKSEYGNRRFKLANGQWYSDFHSGIDFAGEFDVLAADAGTVIGIGTNGIDRGGKLVKGTPANFVKIAHGNGLVTEYWHLKTVKVIIGHIVAKGHNLGLSGRTGVATGTHLHFVVRVNGKTVNPRSKINFNNTSQKPKIMDGEKQTIIIQPGWGLTNIAKTLGLEDNSNTYQALFEYNAGFRGATDWRSLNTLMRPGDELIVGYKPAIGSAASGKLDELEKNIQDLKIQQEEAEKQAEELLQQKEAEILNLKAERERERDELIENLEELNNQIAALEANSVTLPDMTPVTHVALEAIAEEVKARGIKARWHNFVDSRFQSPVIRGLLKYNWYWIVFGIVAYITNALEAIDISAENRIMGTAITAAAGLGSYVIMYLVTHYDRNKDGVITIEDTDIKATFAG